MRTQIVQRRGKPYRVAYPNDLATDFFARGRRFARCSGDEMAIGLTYKQGSYLASQCGFMQSNNPARGQMAPGHYEEGTGTLIDEDGPFGTWRLERRCEGNYRNSVYTLFTKEAN